MRGNPHPHKYKKKQEEIIGFQEFKDGLENLASLRDKSFLAMLYWLGIRISEVLERVREDFWIKKGTLYVRAPPKKKGLKRSPLEISVRLPYVNLIVEQVQRTPRRSRVWSFSYMTGWRFVKKANPDWYPHFFRFNRASKFCEDPEVTIQQLLSWFWWTDMRTPITYISKGRKYVRQLSKKLESEISDLSFVSI